MPRPKPQGPQLLTDNAWDEIIRVRDGLGDTPIRAAIAYYSQDLLQLRQGDLLVCDASEKNIRSGATSGQLLQRLGQAGVQVHHLADLHAKVMVLGRHVVVGSTNASANSATRLSEAAILSTDPHLNGQALVYVLACRDAAERLSPQRLKALAALPVEPGHGAGGGSRKGRQASRRAPQRHWWVSTRPMTEQQLERAQPSADIGLAKAQEATQQYEAEFPFIRYTGTSAFRRQAQAGDRVLDVEARRYGDGKRHRANAPSVIVYRHDAEDATYFFTECTPGARHEHLTYKQLCAALAKAQVKAHKETATREIDADTMAAIDAVFAG